MTREEITIKLTESLNALVTITRDGQQPPSEGDLPIVRVEISLPDSSEIFGYAGWKYNLHPDIRFGSRVHVGDASLDGN